MTQYPLEEIAAALRTAGWDGKASPGWLFHAHVAAEGHSHPAAALRELSERLKVPFGSSDASRAAELITADVVANGARMRKELNVAEITLGGIVHSSNLRA